VLFDTAGRAAGDAKRIVTIAFEVPNATYFIVEPDGEQLAQLGALGLRPEVDSTFPLSDFEAAFARSEGRGKRGKVVLQVHE
jgi:NADPH:quinone reductase-like Zn-dependent oxidoreductase